MSEAQPQPSQAETREVADSLLEKIKSAAFWQAVAERAVNTFWQAFLGSGVAITATTDVSVVKAAAYSALISTLLSVLKSITVGLVSDGNPAVGSGEILATPGATADPVGQATQQTVVPDPTGEIAEQVQADQAVEDEVSKAEAEQSLRQALPVTPDADVAPAPLATSRNDDDLQLS